MRSTRGAADENEGTREALTRVLAIESRNALARVELAASELSRFESSPSAGDRIATIHEAVRQIDGLLAKIDLLASPSSNFRKPTVEVESVWRSIRERLDPTLAARGIRLDESEESDCKAGLRVEMSELALEAILVSLLRLVLDRVGRNQRLRFEVISDAEAVSIALIAMFPVDVADDWQLDPAGQLELKVRLAESGGRLDTGPTAIRGRLGILLPIGDLDG